MLDCRDEVLFYTKQLVQIESIVNTLGEKEIAHVLYSMISSFPYYKQNPLHLIKSPTIDDKLDRYNVLAFVKGTKKSTSRDTVILIGHIDTVGIDDFTQLSDLACNPDELLLALKSEALPDAVRAHADSGEWMFGRGTLDMKSGVASNLFLLRYYSDHPEELEGNLVFLAECDKEDSSNGILSALKDLKLWREQHGFDYIAAINSDFAAPRHEGDENRYIYKGTVGKLLPSFFITGAETHVGSCFEGFDPNLVAAELTRQIDYNPDLCNEALGEVTLPPVSLKQTDMKPLYTVQTALAAYVYYNFFIHSWTPSDVLEKLRGQAELAFQNAINLYTDRYRRFCILSGEAARNIPWQSRVMTFAEMERVLLAANGDEYKDSIESFKEQLLHDESLDVRMFCAKVVEEAWKWMPDKSPAIILFYSSLYSPRVEIEGKNAKEKKLISALDQAVADIQPSYSKPIKVRDFFPYISDMSFIAISDDEESLEAAAKNNPAWGSKLFVDYQDKRDLNVPVVNIGPYGLDAHKRYERMEMRYSLEMVPNLANLVLKYVLEKQG
ncbi:M20/M25/M40 family metallo-hydrolase [Mesobacillus zeae]|uniref:M20/M25/M40 family metallo-hydrolase n=1 Tax=Mesobacillus zeae TaxID=1917180 RepID=A0A398B4T0_9BACI|nr:M20/M25/M40 family metallo-hydrolase [Mesobacillus zeae]RID84444.1 M20/M25/M40 family metallo-hydrolase [Mesobacillus zeae]